jgi:hypothetical protein
MTFFVRKSLALGPIRFGVSPRVLVDSIDPDPSLSTGAQGEFTRRRGDGFFFGDVARVGAPVLPTTRSVSQTPLLSSLKPDGTPRSYGFLAMMGFGIVLVILGLAVVARKGPQGWVEIILGMALIATPIVLTAQKRKQLLAQEERERAEREALERRNREMLTAYTTALDRLRTDRSDTALDQLQREREALTLPFEIWGSSARHTMLVIGFDELARRGPSRSAEVAALLERAGSAAGLPADDVRQIERDLYLTFLWHLLADDRLGAAQEQPLRAIANGLHVSDDLSEQHSVIEQLHRLRGIHGHNLPRRQCTTQLGFQEHCVHETSANGATLHLTNKRLILDAKKRNEILLPKVFDLEVDADKELLTIKSDQKKPLELQLPDPIYTAALIDLARSLDTRPRGFA